MANYFVVETDMSKSEVENLVGIDGVRELTYLEYLLSTMLEGDESGVTEIDTQIQSLMEYGYPGKTEFTIRSVPDADGNLNTSVDTRTRLQMPSARRIFSKHRTVKYDNGELIALEGYPPGPQNPSD